MKHLFLLLCVLSLSLNSVAQADENETLDTRRDFFFIVPAVSYTPETKWGAGVVSMYNFYMNFEDTISPASSVQLWSGYTQNKQFLVYVPFNFIWNERKWISKGQIGFYKYFYYYYGYGEQLLKDRESYEVDFPRVRVDLHRKIHSRWYAGVRMWYEDYQFKRFDEGGQLDTFDVPGKEGGAIFGAGALVSGDFRDNVFYPRKGWLVEGVTQPFGSGLSNYSFWRNRFDIRKYSSLSEKLVVANQIFVDVVNGNTPFYSMPFLGGQNRMRGLIEGSLRDKSAWIFQTEFRAEIYKRFGAVAFLSAGSTSQSLSEFQLERTVFAGGGGLRFTLDKEKHMNLRFDAAWARDQFNYYITIGEAF